MKANKYYVVGAEVGDSLEEMKQEMFRLCKASNDESNTNVFGKDWSNTSVFGIFNGQLYICYGYYDNYEQIDIY